MPPHGGDEQDGSRDARAPDGFDQGETVGTRQHAVDDDQVIGFSGGEEKPIAAVGRLVYDVPVLLESGGDVVGRFAIVLDDQNLHESGVVRMGVAVATIEPQLSVSDEGRSRAEYTPCLGISHVDRLTRVQRGVIGAGLARQRLAARPPDQARTEDGRNGERDRKNPLGLDDGLLAHVEVDELARRQPDPSRVTALITTRCRIGQSVSML